jgi:hypothetical protein
MPQRFKAPDGTLLDFPDDMSQSDIDAIMRRTYSAPKAVVPVPQLGPGVTMERVKGTRETPIRLTTQTQRTIEPGQYFTAPNGKVYQHTPGSGAAPPRPSVIGGLAAANRAATREVFPTLFGAIPGMVMGAGVGTAAGLATGPAAPIAAPVLGILGGLGGAFVGRNAVNAAQERLLANMPEGLKTLFGQNEAQRREDTTTYPRATAAGAATPGFLIGRPTLKASELVLGGAFGAGAETVRQSYAGEKPDLARIATMAGMGAAQAKPTRLATIAMGTPETSFQRGARETVQPKGARAQRSKADASAEMRGTQSTLRGVGIAARPVDVMDQFTTAAVLTPAGAASNEATRLITKYGDVVRGGEVGSTQVAGKRAAGELAPEIPGVTAQGLATKAAEEITAAGESVQPGVKLGEASTEVARTLAKQAAADKADMEAKYDVTETLGISTVQMPRPGEGPWKPITPQQAKQYAKGQVDNPADPLMFNAATSEVAPRSQLGPQNVAEFNAELRDPISGFMEDPDSIKPVISVLNKLEQDGVSTLDTTNLFGARKRLSAIARDFKGSPAGVAADRVKRKLDEVMGVWADNNRFSGPAEVVDSMRDTTATARKYYGNWKSGNILETVTETKFGPDGRETVLDPEAARRAMFGSLTDTNASLGSMKVLRDQLGADSAEWNALRREALEQRVGVDTDKGKFIKNLEKFERENPAMADLLLTPTERATFTRAKGRVGAATDVQAALKTGDAALTALPADFEAAVSGLTGAPLRAAKVALRSNLEQRLGSSGGALAVLQSLETGTAARANVAKLLGAAEAEKLFRRAEVLVQRQQRAESAGAVVTRARRDTRDTEGVRAGERAAGQMMFLAPLFRYLEARGMSPAQALQTAKDAIDPNKTEATIKYLAKLYGENGAQAFLRRVRATMARDPLLGSLPRRISQQGVITAAAPPGEEPEASKDEAAPEIGEPLPQEQADKELFKFFGVTPDAKNNVPPPPKPPTAADEGAALSRDDLHARVEYQESRGNPNAVSPKGAEGKMQVMPKTQVSPGFGVRPVRNNSLAEKERVGHDYLDALVAHYKDVEHALMAYNWGPKNVDNWLAGSKRPIPQETRDYVRAILGRDG